MSAQFRIAELAGVGRGTVRLATMNGLASGLMPLLCQRFTDGYPDIRFEIRSLLPPPDIAKAAEGGEVSLGLGCNLVPTANQRTIATYGARLGVVAAAHHLLAARPWLRLADLAAHRVVMTDASLTIRAIVDAACKKADVILDISFETNSVQLIKFLVSQGQALAFLSSPDVDTEVGDGSFVFLQLKDRPPIPCG
ncbi:MAG: LysR substrate-binding domain-containing protein [Candidatus Devosia euplotis]|nr:LysR substrate-binding domain-containing protein [Candidatus Devosia euplotis]